MEVYYYDKPIKIHYRLRLIARNDTPVLKPREVHKLKKQGSYNNEQNVPALFP